MKPAFPGFSPEALTFFAQLEENNTREWFQPRKEHYERVLKAPMAELVTAINSGLVKFAPDFVTDPKDAIFRIYRDTRFSKDKTPYKDHIAASFGRRGNENPGGSGFYFSFNHKRVDVGGGVYHPGTDMLRIIRSHIAETHQDFEKILATRKFRTLMGGLQGDELSRVPKGFDPDHPAAKFLKKKDWIFIASVEPKLLTSPKLLPEILTRFEIITPAIEYLNAPLRARKKKPTIYPL